MPNTRWLGCEPDAEMSRRGGEGFFLCKFQHKVASRLKYIFITAASAHHFLAFAFNFKVFLLIPRIKNAYTPLYLCLCLSQCGNVSQQTLMFEEIVNLDRARRTSRMKSFLFVFLVLFYSFRLPLVECWWLKAFPPPPNRYVSAEDERKVKNSQGNCDFSSSFLCFEVHNFSWKWILHFESERGRKVPPPQQQQHSLARELFHVKQIFMLIFCVGNLWSNKQQNTLFDINDFDCKYIIGKGRLLLSEMFFGREKGVSTLKLPMKQSKLNLCILTRRSKVSLLFVLCKGWRGFY